MSAMFPPRPTSRTYTSRAVWLAIRRWRLCCVVIFTWQRKASATTVDDACSSVGTLGWNTSRGPACLSSIPSSSSPSSPALAWFPKLRPSPVLVWWLPPRSTGLCTRPPPPSLPFLCSTTSIFHTDDESQTQLSAERPHCPTDRAAIAELWGWRRRCRPAQQHTHSDTHTHIVRDGGRHRPDTRSLSLSDTHSGPPVNVSDANKEWRALHEDQTQSCCSIFNLWVLAAVEQLISVW